MDLPDFGVCTALVTPMEENGKLDLPALERLLSRQKEDNAAALLALGTTGEGALLSDGERVEILREIKSVYPAAFLIAGCGSNDAKKAAGLAILAKNCGADALLAVTPYYGKCTEEGVKDYYRRIRQAGLPVLAYNVPQRTGYDLPLSVVCDLYEEGVLSGIKECSADLRRIMQLASRGVSVYSGNDDSALPAYAVGAKGCFSVTANISYAKVAEVYRLLFQGKIVKARKADERLRPLTAALFSEVNPVPVKAALHLLGVIQEGIRPPLTPLSPQKKRQLVQTLVRGRYL